MEPPILPPSGRFRLRIHIIAQIDAQNLEATPLRNFILAKSSQLPLPDLTLKQLCNEVVKRYQQLYPGSTLFVVDTTQDANASDLWLEDSVHDLFEDNDIFRVIKGAPIRNSVDPHRARSHSMRPEEISNQQIHADIAASDDSVHSPSIDHVQTSILDMPITLHEKATNESNAQQQAFASQSVLIPDSQPRSVSQTSLILEPRQNLPISPAEQAASLSNDSAGIDAEVQSAQVGSGHEREVIVDNHTPDNTHASTWGFSSPPPTQHRLDSFRNSKTLKRVSLTSFKPSHREVSRPTPKEDIYEDLESIVDRIERPIFLAGSAAENMKIPRDRREAQRRDLKKQKTNLAEKRRRHDEEWRHLTDAVAAEEYRSGIYRQNHIKQTQAANKTWEDNKAEAFAKSDPILQPNFTNSPEKSGASQSEVDEYFRDDAEVLVTIDQIDGTQMPQRDQSAPLKQDVILLSDNCILAKDLLLQGKASKSTEEDLFSGKSTTTSRDSNRVSCTPFIPRGRPPGLSSASQVPSLTIASSPIGPIASATMSLNIRRPVVPRAFKRRGSFASQLVAKKRKNGSGSRNLTQTFLIPPRTTVDSVTGASGPSAAERPLKQGVRSVEMTDEGRSSTSSKISPKPIHISSNELSVYSDDSGERELLERPGNMSTHGNCPSDNSISCGLSHSRVGGSSPPKSCQKFSKAPMGLTNGNVQIAPSSGSDLKQNKSPLKCRSPRADCNKLIIGGQPTYGSPKKTHDFLQAILNIDSQVVPSPQSLDSGHLQRPWCPSSYSTQSCHLLQPVNPKSCHLGCSTQSQESFPNTSMATSRADLAFQDNDQMQRSNCKIALPSTSKTTITENAIEQAVSLELSGEITAPAITDGNSSDDLESELNPPCLTLNKTKSLQPSVSQSGLSCISTVQISPSRNCFSLILQTESSDAVSSIAASPLTCETETGSISSSEETFALLSTQAELDRQLFPLRDQTIRSSTPACELPPQQPSLANRGFSAMKLEWNAHIAAKENYEKYEVNIRSLGTKEGKARRDEAEKRDEMEEHEAVEGDEEAAAKVDISSTETELYTDSDYSSDDAEREAQDPRVMGNLYNGTGFRKEVNRRNTKPHNTATKNHEIDETELTRQEFSAQIKNLGLNRSQSRSPESKTANVNPKPRHGPRPGRKYQKHPKTGKMVKVGKYEYINGPGDVVTDWKRVQATLRRQAASLRDSFMH